MGDRDALWRAINDALNRYPLINLERGEYEAIAATAADACESAGWVTPEHEDDLPAAHPTVVDGYELAKQLHLHHRAYEVQPPCDMCKAQAGNLLASGVLTDAAQVRAQAWDEGYKTGRAQERLGIYPPADNPYRGDA